MPDRRTIYVSTAGNDASDGSAPCSPRKTIPNIDQADVLLRRGDTFILTGTIPISGSMTLGAYGSGPNPILLSPPSIQFAIALSASAHDVCIDGIDFDSTTPGNLNKDGAATAIQAAGQRITIRNCVARNVCDFVNANGQPNGLFIIGCSDTGPTSVRGYFAWLQGSNIALITNTCQNSTREHCVRVGGATNLSVCGNSFANIDRTAVDQQDIAKATINCQIVRNALIAGNTLTSGGLGVGPLGGADGVSHPESIAENVIVADNSISMTSMAVTSGAHRVILSGNQIHNITGAAIRVTPTDTSSPVYASRTLTDLAITGNHHTLDGPVGNFLWVANPPSTGSITLTTNTMTAPQFTTGADQSAAVFVLAPMRRCATSATIGSCAGRF